MSESIEAFRQEVKAWIDESLPQELRSGPRSGAPKEVLQRWYDALTGKGWLTPDWPTEYGGGGLDRKQTQVVKAELRAARAPVPPASAFGTRMLGPTLLEFGTEEQKLHFLPQISRHELQWCQGYSEPGAGSDLASLQTRAVREGDEYVITGQKIWTTGADKADWIFCLVRTDPDAPKHDGISFILFPMHQPGVKVSPLTLIDGNADFSQVFFDGGACEGRTRGRAGERRLDGGETATAARAHHRRRQ